MGKSRIECIDCGTHACIVKRYCSHEQLMNVSKHKNFNSYKKGDSIFREGNTMLGIHFLQSGGVKVVTPTLNDREQVVRLASEGNILGHRVFENDKYFFNAIALMDSNVCFIETAVFKETCLSGSDFSYNVILFYALELRRAELRVKYHAQMNVREKVAQAFIYLKDVFGINTKTLQLNVDLSRRELADVAGTTSEQVTRQLNDFEGEKLIARSKREIQLINVKGIEQIIRDYRIE